MPTELTLERMVHGGACLARLPDGRVALVDGGVPGERVRVELEVRKGVARGTLVEVVEPSADRVAAPAHPGLDLGHVRYERQLELKRAIVEDALRRALGGDAVPIPEVRAAPAVWGYRAAVQPAVAPGGLGYRRRASDVAVVLDEDPTANAGARCGWELARERVADADGVHELAIRGDAGGDVLLALVAGVPERDLLDLAHALVRAGARGVGYARFDPRGRFRSGSSRLAGARTMLQRFGRFAMTVNATSFAQPNPEAAGALFEEAAAWLGGGRHAWELFAGGGAIAFHLAEGFERVTAVEIDRASVARGEADAARLGLANVTFVRSDARAAPLPSDADVVVVDPPRAGLAAGLRAALAEEGPPRLLYVSCDAATWARDAAELTRAGYRLARVLPFDFYPHTHHVEVLSLLER